MLFYNKPKAGDDLGNDGGRRKKEFGRKKETFKAIVCKQLKDFVQKMKNKKSLPTWLSAYYWDENERR